MWNAMKQMLPAQLTVAKSLQCSTNVLDDLRSQNKIVICQRRLLEASSQTGKAASALSFQTCNLQETWRSRRSVRNQDDRAMALFSPSCSQVLVRCSTLAFHQARRIDISTRELYPLLRLAPLSGRAAGFGFVDTTLNYQNHFCRPPTVSTSGLRVGIYKNDCHGVNGSG